MKLVSTAVTVLVAERRVESRELRVESLRRRMLLRPRTAALRWS
jgi:hypothetical protein